MTSSRQLSLLLVLATALVAMAFRARSDDGYLIIVNAANPVTELSRARVTRFFYKRETRWSDGSAVQPVDQDLHSAVRHAFSRAVLGRPAVAVAEYWQQQVMSGLGMPPVERDADAEVAAFVEANPGAIGYVSPEAPIEAGVKVISMR